MTKRAAGHSQHLAVNEFAPKVVDPIKRQVFFLSEPGNGLG
jgi:hypothetical protein